MVSAMLEESRRVVSLRMSAMKVSKVFGASPKASRAASASNLLRCEIATSPPLFFSPSAIDNVLLQTTRSDTNLARVFKVPSADVVKSMYPRILSFWIRACSPTLALTKYRFPPNKVPAVLISRPIEWIRSRKKSKASFGCTTSYDDDTMPNGESLSERCNTTESSITTTLCDPRARNTTRLDSTFQSIPAACFHSSMVALGRISTPRPCQGFSPIHAISTLPSSRIVNSCAIWGNSYQYDVGD